MIITKMIRNVCIKVWVLFATVLKQNNRDFARTVSIRRIKIVRSQFLCFVGGGSRGCPQSSSVEFAAKCLVMTNEEEITSGRLIIVVTDRLPSCQFSFSFRTQRKQDIRFQLGLGLCIADLSNIGNVPEINLQIVLNKAKRFLYPLW